MVLKAIPLGYGGLACELAALLSERDIFRGDYAAPDADLRLRVEAFRSAGEAGRPAAASALGYTVDPAACRRIRSEVNHLKRTFAVLLGGEDDVNDCGLLLAFAYPDRIAQRKLTGRFLMRNGRGAAFTETQPLANASYLVAAQLDDQGTDSRIFLAAPLELNDLEQHFGDQIEEETIIIWERGVRAVQARKRQRLGALVLKDAPVPDQNSEDTLEALLRGIREEGLEILPWTRAARQLRQRLNFMHRLEPEWPDVSDEALVATLRDWFAPHVYGMKSWAELQCLDLA